MGFYIWIALAVWLWVYFWLSFYNDASWTWNKIKNAITTPCKKVWSSIKKGTKFIVFDCIPIVLKWLLVILVYLVWLAIPVWIIYLLYLLGSSVIKNRDSIWFFVICIVGALLIPIIVLLLGKLNRWELKQREKWNKQKR